jgi:hypothetical protein
VNRHGYNDRRTKEKAKKRINWPLLVSCLSLVISCTSFYYSNFFVRESLKVACHTTYHRTIGDTLFIDLIYDVYDSFMEKTGAAVIKSGDERTLLDSPFVVKPGDAVVKDIKSFLLIKDIIEVETRKVHIFEYFSFTLTNPKGISYTMIPSSDFYIAAKSLLWEEKETVENFELI